MKVLLITMYFPPAGGGGVQRPLKLATHLPALGIETHVLAPDDPKWLHRDEELRAPTQENCLAMSSHFTLPIYIDLTATCLYAMTGALLAIAGRSSGSKLPALGPAG